MGFSVYYRSTRPVTPAQAEAVERAAAALCRGRSWLGCEPVQFYPDPGDGHLHGGSKPNLLPHPDDAASAARSGLPDGTTRDLLDVLCRLSRDHRIDWEISHDYSGGPVGHVRDGVCGDEVSAELEGFADLGDVLGELEAGFAPRAGGFPLPGSHGHEPGEDEDEDEDGGPRILSFRPRGT